MQITIANPGEPGTDTPFTLMLAGQQYRLVESSPLLYEVDASSVCPLCSNRIPEWFAPPASDAAMNPDASPIKSPECCTPCLNELITNGTVEVTNVDPHSF